MSRILTGAVPRTACSNVADALGASAPASDSAGGMSDAPPAMEIEVSASRRFIIGLLAPIGMAIRRRPDRTGR